MQIITMAKGYEGLLMSYQERLEWFCMWADHYGLIIITPKYTPNDECRKWAN